MRNIGKSKRSSKIKEILLEYIKNNLREIAIITIIFLIGLVFGIIFVNNSGREQANEISSYINEFVNSLKSNIQINKAELLKDALISNFLLVVILWFVGSTVIGIPIVYGVIAYKGFCLGYTISSSIATIGIRKRNYIYNDIITTSKYIVYTMYISFGSKWDETI